MPPARCAAARLTVPEYQRTSQPVSTVTMPSSSNPGGWAHTSFPLLASSSQ